MEPTSGQSTPTPTPFSFPPAPDSRWGQWSPALLQRTVKQGMTALKQQQYEQAIAILEPILNHVKQPIAIAQLQKALAKAYMALEDDQKALDYCQALRSSPDPALQTWARRAIAHLKKQYPQRFDIERIERIERIEPIDPAVTLSDGDHIRTSPIPTPNDPAAHRRRPAPSSPSVPRRVRSSKPISKSASSSTSASRRHQRSTPSPTAHSASLTDPGFKPLSSASGDETSTASPLDELVRKLDHVPSPSPASISPDSADPKSSTPTSPSLKATAKADQLSPDQASVSSSAATANSPDRTKAQTTGANSISLSDSPDRTSKVEAATQIQSPKTFIQSSSEPSDAGPTPSPTPAVAIAALPWKPVDRAKRWSPIPNKLTSIQRFNTVLTYAWTAIALWGIATLFLQFGMALGNPVREWISQVMRFERWYFLEYHPGRVAAMVLGGLLLLAPVLLHFWLRWSYKTRSFSLSELGRHSPEAQQLLQRSCKKHKHPLPRLCRISTQTPVLLSYGWRPRLSWIVVSDGLLRQLSEDEIAALYAAELSHVRQWSLWLLTGVTVATQISYSLYQGLARWGDRCRNGFLQWLGGTGVAIAYGMFWLVRHSGLWLARSRCRHSDRVAANLTGNPNGVARGLLKVAIATATDIRRQGKTAPILEQFEWLMPVGYRSAISAGSVFPIQWQSSREGHTTENIIGQSLESTILAWDYRNPYRHWMAINNTHSPLGDRLYTLTRYAQHWRLEPELSLPSLPRIPNSGKIQQQMAPFFGLPIGAGISLLLWIVGIVANQFDWPIEWLRYEATSIFWGMLAMGFSFGTILRMNAFFPDMTTATPASTDLSDLSDLLNRSDRLPIDSQPVHLTGKLLGRKGSGNWLNQDLILQTQTGMVRLHCISMLGTIGHLIFDTIRLTALKGRTVTVTGWLRRGATPWIDVNTIQAQRGKPIQSGHPIWSTILAIALTLWGAYILYQTNL